MNAPTLDKRLISLVIALLLLVAAVAAVVYFWPKAQEAARITYYVCPDESYYLVVEEGKVIRVAGRTYERVPGSSPAVYGEGSLRFEISEAGLRVLNSQQDQAPQTCTPQAPDIDVVVSDT